MSDTITLLSFLLVLWILCDTAVSVTLREMRIRRGVQNAKRISMKCECISDIYSSNWERLANAKIFYKEVAHNYYKYGKDGKIESFGEYKKFNNHG